jgi:hypothetical protein
MPALPFELAVLLIMMFLFEKLERYIPQSEFAEQVLFESILLLPPSEMPRQQFAEHMFFDIMLLVPETSMP